MKISLTKAATLAVISSLSLITASPSYGQAISPELDTAAREACTEEANTRGYTVNDVVSVNPGTVTDTLAVVLNLEQAGVASELTCSYNTAENRVLEFEGPEATPETAPVAEETSSTFPWWILIPILGLPLLWFLGRKPAPRTTPQVYRSQPNTPLRARVRNYGATVNTYAGPSLNHKVTGSLTDGQEVILTGKSESDWSELDSGNWVSNQYLDFEPRYAE